MEPVKPTKQLFTLRAGTVPPAMWERFKEMAHANGHSLAALFRAFIASYIRRGIGDAEQDYKDPHK